MGASRVTRCRGRSQDAANSARFLAAKSRLRAVCEGMVAADAVTVEPVSTAGFPANKEINREFRQIRRFNTIFIANTRANTAACTEIPYTKEQGIISAEQGIPAREQGIFTDQIRNHHRMRFSVHTGGWLVDIRRAPHHWTCGSTPSKMKTTRAVAIATVQLLSDNCAGELLGSWRKSIIASSFGIT